VLGSHADCDLVLTDDGSIWGRHLAAVWVRLFEDDPDSWILRLIDLQTAAPIFLNDDRPRRSVDAPFAVRVGHHVICALPVASGAAVPDPSRWPPMDPRPKPTMSAASGVRRRRRQHVLLTVDDGRASASVEVPIEAFDDGVVLGRGNNCFDGGLRSVLSNGSISGAHLLLLRDWDRVVAVDLCSTNGTHVAGQRIRSLRTRREATLRLGKKVNLRIRCLKGEG
jgi:hypothetical protein